MSRFQKIALMGAVGAFLALGAVAVSRPAVALFVASVDSAIRNVQSAAGVR